MKYATTYSNCCLQVVLVYLHPFHCDSLLKCAAAKNCRKITKTPYFGGSRSLIVKPLKSFSGVIVMVSNKCISASARQANSGKITTFYGVPLYDAYVRRPP